MQEHGPRWAAAASLRSFPRAFIIRPFGKKQVGADGTTIDFQLVEDKLIRPAMELAEVAGATTEVYNYSGPIQRDMFQRLVTAQLVIADISIHNANVYYELGIRHALRDKHTFLIRSRVAGHDMPFDIRTERSLVYDMNDLDQMVEELAAGLKATLRRSDYDSPVFSFVPELAAQDPSRFIAAPDEFVRQVERAVASGRSGDILFLAEEVAREDWGLVALRLAGRAQLSLKSWAAAARTWEQVRAMTHDDIEADLQLGAVYQHLRSYAESRRALGRLRASTLSADLLAKTNALLGENATRRWMDAWRHEASGARPREALKSPFLREAYTSFLEAFEADLHDIRYGVNALLIGSVIQNLAARFTDVWEDLDFDEDDGPDRVLQRIADDVRGLPTSIERAARTAARREQSRLFEPNTALWCRAELKLLTGDKSGRVADAYRKVANASEAPLLDWLRERLQLLIDLGVLGDRAQLAKDALGPAAPVAPPTSPPQTVLVFMGMLEDDMRVSDAIRFATGLGSAIADIGPPRELIAFAGASPADIVFHQVCESAQIRSTICVSHDTTDFRQAGVQSWGTDWEQNFNRVSQRIKVETLQDGSALPSWVTASRGGRKRANRWLIYRALEFGCPVVLMYPPASSPDSDGAREELLRHFRDERIRSVPVTIDASERKD